MAYLNAGKTIVNKTSSHYIDGSLFHVALTSSCCYSETKSNIKEKRSN